MFKRLVNSLFGWRSLRLARYRWYRQWQGIPEPRRWTTPELQAEMNRVMGAFASQMEINVNREYDPALWSSIKSGQTIKIRRPNRYVS